MKRILITASGGSTTNNLIRGLRRAKEEYFIIGTNIDDSYLANSLADKNYKIPRVDSGAIYVKTIKIIIDSEEVDIFIPNSDIEVEALAEPLQHWNVQKLFPSPETIRLCQDKLELQRFLSDHGFRVPETYSITDLEEIEKIFDQFVSSDRLWCRMRKGMGSKGSLPVNHPDQVRFWIKYWNEMRGVPVDYFTLSEYLPGRDFAFQSLWKDGELIIAKACERLDYLFGGVMPSGSSSTPRVGKLVNNEEVNEVCYHAIRMIDSKATGMFCVDLKETKDGIPCITEINIGRFFTISPVFNNVGRYNMAELFVKIASGESVHIDEADRFTDTGDESYYLVREPDSEPLVITEKKLTNNCIDLSNYEKPE
jgi:carbamoyl-phosphate synthase large subunit